MRATVVVDNIAADGLSAEWGLCFYIEYGGLRILLDTGSSALFAKNAESLKLPLEQVDAAVLSHAHYDHANGMETFFKANGKAKFFLQESCAENCYSRKRYFFRKYIGLPRGVLNRYPDRTAFVSGKTELFSGVFLLPHSTPVPEAVGMRDRLYILEGRRLRPDPFLHEQSLIFDTTDGLVVFNSCCHSGADRVVREAMEAFPGKAVHAVVGGFHLHNKTEAEVLAFADRLRETGVKIVYTGHCTGKESFRILKGRLGSCVQQMHTGLVIEF